MTRRPFLLFAALALIGCGTSPPPAGSSGAAEDTIPIVCSCGGTWREPVSEVRHWPLPLYNRCRHGRHPLPHDLREQIEARLEAWNIKRALVVVGLGVSG